MSRDQPFLLELPLAELVATTVVIIFVIVVVRANVLAVLHLSLQFQALRSIVASVLRIVIQWLFQMLVGQG